MQFKIQNFLKAILILFFTFHFSLLTSHLSSAQTVDEQLYQERQSQLEDNRAKQAELQQKIVDTQNQGQTLKNQISYLDNRIHLTQLQIAETQGKIVQLQDQLQAVGASIEELRVKLGRLNEAIGFLDQIYAARLRASYQTIFTTYSSPLELFLSSRSFQDGILSFTILQALQQEDRKLIAQMQDTRGAYLAQQTQLTLLKQEKEQLKTQMEKQRALLQKQQQDLAEQKKSKDYLLEITQNEEARYQQLLQEARREQEAIEAAVNEVLRRITGRVLEGTHVKQGEIIGIQGSTGKSTGPHLHFGYYPCGDWTCPNDPSPKLGDGSFVWPMDNYAISQGFGLTDFARSGFYGYDANGSPKGHNGIDMYGPTNSAIKAAHSGEVFYTVDGWGGQGAIIRDESGFITIYWHLQPKN